MTKKYLSLDEAARILGMAPEELVRLREKGEIRGFADRGNWKFKQDDVESLARRRQADSSPEVPLYDSSSEGTPGLGEQPTTIRRNAPNGDEHLLSSDDVLGKHSDSDVRLVGSADSVKGFGTDSDSDVKLQGSRKGSTNAEGTEPEIPVYNPGSDSDVKLTAGDSDSDVQLIGDVTEPIPTQKRSDDRSDFDVKKMLPENSDSDVQLVGQNDPGLSDISLLRDDDDAVAIDFNTDHGNHASVLDDESGIALSSSDSSLLMGESGISLAGPSDSGIGLDLGEDDDSGLTLALDDESGISLDAGESGISLEAVDSGITLEGSGIKKGDYLGTVPMMDILADDDDQTNMEIPALDDRFDSSDADVTGVMDLHDGADDVFTLDDEAEEAEDHFEAEDMDLEADSFEEEHDLDVFDAGEEAFEGAETSGLVTPGAGRMAPAEAEWGTLTFAGLTVASVLLLVCGVVMIDLVKHTATATQLNPVSGKVVEMLGGAFKS